MRIKKTYDFEEFTPWGGAIDVFDKIKESGKLHDFEVYCEDFFNDEEVDELALNDLLWFDWEEVFRSLGIHEDEEDEEDE